MLRPGEAKNIIREHAMTLIPVRVPLQEAAGFVLAEDQYASIDIPAFPQSSVDGYAISYEGWQLNKRLKLKGQIVAGSSEVFTLVQDKAIRIFTGAAVPAGADTVVMQEKIKISSTGSDTTNSEYFSVNSELIIEDEKLQQGANVRPKGSEIKAGTLALAKDTFLSPAAIGFLAGIGISEIPVFPNPVITIIVTGNELQQPGTPLAYGQVYESNSIALKAVLQQLHFTDITIQHVGDRLEAVMELLKKALEESDFVLLTGGVSAGDYDFVLPASANCGVQQLFHKIKQRPGKPLYFGKKENKLVFGLPGNPSSVLTCFYEYVIPALEKLCKRVNTLQAIEVPLAKPFRKNTDLTHFLKGFYDGKTAMPFDAQESYRMSSFAKANCLIQINEDRMEYKEGEKVEIHLLPSR